MRSRGAVRDVHVERGQPTIPKLTGTAATTEAINQSAQAAPASPCHSARVYRHPARTPPACQTLDGQTDGRTLRCLSVRVPV